MSVNDLIRELEAISDRIPPETPFPDDPVLFAAQRLAAPGLHAHSRRLIWQTITLPCREDFLMQARISKLFP